MKTRRIELPELIRLLGDDIKQIWGEPDNCYIDNIADITNTNETTLDWINPNRTDRQKVAENSPAKVLLVDENVQYSEKLKDQDKILLVVANPKLSLAKTGNYFFVEKASATVHPTAILNPNAKIGKGVHIGPNSIIGECFIGEDCVIDTNVRIHDNVTLGNGCVIKAGAVLGGEGFGYEKDEDGKLFRFPQVGGLVIGNFVEIGSNTTIDRGALSNTSIGDHTKINNLCHIAHNNTIGANVIVAGCVNISGSNIINDNVWIAPNATIRGWIHIGKGATIGMGAVIIKDVPAGETWIGNPARKYEKK